MIPPHTNRYPKPPSGAATGWGRFFCVSDQGERAATGGAAKPLRPRKLGQSFGPEPLCRFATSPRAAGSHPTAWGAFCAGKARERSLPSQGRWPRSRPEGLLRFAAAVGRGGVKTPPYGAIDTWAVMAKWRAGHARPLRTAVKIYAREGQGRAAALPPLPWAGAAVPCSPPFPRRAKPDDACAKRGGQRFYGEAVPGLRQRRRGGSLHGPCASRRG